MDGTLDGILRPDERRRKEVRREAVLRTCGADFVLSPEKIAHALVSLTMAPRVSTALFGPATGRWRYRIRAA